MSKPFFCLLITQALYFSKGNVLRRLLRYDEALVSYDQAIRLDPTNAHAYLNRGDTYLELGKDEEALVSYDQATSLDPTNALAYYSKAKILRQLRQYDEASIASEKALSLGFNVEDTGIVESSPILRTRIEQVQKFLMAAGFDCATLSNAVGFLARPKIPIWRARFPRGLYVRVLFDNPLDDRTVRSIYDDFQKHSDHALVIINTQPDISGWGEINVLRGAQGKNRFVCLPITEMQIQEGTRFTSRTSNTSIIYP